MQAAESPIVGVKNPPESEVFERNYETECPSLYEAIESASNQADFDRILQFLDTGKWDGSFFTTGYSPAVQAKTWVTRFDEADKGKVKWSQLPLHLAIVCGAPKDFIKKLTKLYPQALRCTDDQHMLPLHLALRHGASDEVVAFLLTEFPEGVNAKGKNGRTAVECAQRAKDKLRGTILGTFVDRTKSRISSSVVNERAALKKVIMQLKGETGALKSELDAQYSVIAKLKSETNRTKTELEKASGAKDEVESNLLRQLHDVEASAAEQGTEHTYKTDKIESAKLLESVNMQRKVDELESEKKELESTVEKLSETEISLRTALERMQERVSKSVSPEDWDRLKKEVTMLQDYRLKNSRTEIKAELNALKAELERSLREAKTVDSKNSKLKSELKGELKNITKTVVKLQGDEINMKTTAEMDKLRSEVKSLRADLKSRAEASKTKIELAVLKKAMEGELRNAQGKTEEDLDALRQAVRLANEKNLSSKTADELAKVKAELESVKKGMSEKELVTKTVKDVEAMREALASDMQNADSKSKAELAALKENLEALATQMADPKSKEEIVNVKQEVEVLKDELKKMESSTKIQEEAAVLKKNVEAELQKSQGKTQEELVFMQQAIMALTTKALNNKDADQLADIKNELNKTKEELKEIEEATKTQVEVVVLKKALEVQLDNATGNNEREIAEMKKAVDAINMENREGKKLKKALAEEIKRANAKSEKELLEIKKALDSINFKQVESKNKDEWEIIRRDMENLKEELEVKTVTEMTLAEQELYAMKKVVEAINLKEKKMENKNKSEFGAIRKEMEALKAELKQKGDSEASLQRAISDLKAQGQARALEHKKDKAGLKKFLSRRFTKKAGDKDTPKRSNVHTDSIEFTASIETSMDDVSTLGPPSPSKVSTILPPGLADRFGKKTREFPDENDSISDDSEYRAEIMNAKSKDSVDSGFAAAAKLEKKSLPPLPPVPKQKKASTQKASKSPRATSPKATSPKATSPKASKSSKVSSSKSPKELEPVSSESSDADEGHLKAYEMTRTLSKCTVTQDGDVELEAVEPSSPFARAFGFAATFS